MRSSTRNDACFMVVAQITNVCVCVCVCVCVSKGGASFILIHKGNPQKSL